MKLKKIFFLLKWTPWQILKERKGEIMAVLPISYKDTLYNKTGCWREITPEFLEKIPPCVLNCPLKQDIPKIFSLISRDCWKGAYQILTEKNPFPAICGRVCYCACENNCNRKDYDDPLLIKKAEKEIGDTALDVGFVPIFPPLNQKIKVLIVGAGIAGLSAAYFLRKNGIEAKVFEKQTRFGGLARIIPDFRLHSEILDLEIKKIIKAANISVAVASPISKSFLEDAIGQNFYQAVILATGSKPKPLNICGEEFAVSADEFLKMAKLNPGAMADRRYNNIVVLGGGNTAMDVALVCRDLFPKAMISIIAPEVYWDMTAFKEMKQAVLNARIGIFNSATVVNIKKFIGGWFDLEFQTDYGGYLRNGVSMIISAIGRESEINLFPEKPLLECYKKLFFAGDIKGTGSVAESIADARRTVEKVLLYLRRGKRDVAVEITIDRGYFFSSNKDRQAARPNLVYFLKQKRNWKDITKEAERCINCGVCLDCENCLNFCPDAAIRRFFNQNKACYEIDYDYCKGCLICAEECPSGVICRKMEVK